MFKRFNYYTPSLAQSWVIVGWLILGSLALGLGLGILYNLTGSPFFRTTTFSYICTMIVPLAYAYVAANRRPPFGEPVCVPLNKPDFGKCSGFVFFVVLFFALLALSVIIEPLSNAIPMNDYFKSLFEQVFEESALWDMIIATCIMAPLAEEFLCRGLMQRGMIHCGMKPWKAILWSAFIFAFIHLNPWQAIPAFAFGCFFGWVYWKSGCLWATIFMHFLNNSMSTLLTRLFPDIEIDTGWVDILPKTQYIILYVACVLVFAGAVLFIKKNYDKKTISA